MSTPELGLIIEPEELLPFLGKSEVLIIDICQTQTYEQVHIPGAIHVPASSLVSGMKPATGKLPEKQKLTELFSKIGYSKDKHIIVYDDEGGGWAGRFIWTLDIIGHKKYSYLNGGIHSWVKEGHPIDTSTPRLIPADVNLVLDHSCRASKDQVMASINDENIQIWDARSAEEYEGIKVTAQRVGHIPGAFNLDWLDTMDKTRNLRLFPKDKLREKLSAAGYQDGKQIITHCQTHHRSGLTYLIAKWLDIPVQAYDGSWSEWGNSPDTPIE